MRIIGANGITQPASHSQVRRAGTGGFMLPGERIADPAAARGAAGLAGVDTLLALQGVTAAETATERRRRQTKRAHAALDALDGLRLGLIEGRIDRGALAALGRATAAAREETGDSGLDVVLQAVDLRAQVELAKIEAGALRDARARADAARNA